MFYYEDFKLEKIKERTISAENFEKTRSKSSKT